MEIGSISSIPAAAPALPAEALALIEGQYADRPHLRAALDGVLAALPRVGATTVEVRTRQVSLVGPIRTYAYLQAATLRHVDLKLRLPAALAPGGRFQADTRKGVVEFGVRAGILSPDGVDEELIGWLRRAYDYNAVPRLRRVPLPRPRPARVGRAVIVIEGSDLPGRSCRPDPTGHGHFNVHAGLVTHATSAGGVGVVPHRPWTVTGLVPGDAPAARWELEVRVVFAEDGIDLRGPAVEGQRGNRHFGIAWGELGDDGSFRLFRRFGFRVRDIDPALLEAAAEPGRRLVVRLGLTDTKGNPLCAAVPRRAAVWSVESAP